MIDWNGLLSPGYVIEENRHSFTGFSIHLIVVSRPVVFPQAVGAPVSADVYTSWD